MNTPRVHSLVLVFMIVLLSGCVRHDDTTAQKPGIYPLQEGFVDANGVVHQGIGITSPDMFTQSWESARVKVLIFIRGAGPVPYPDDLLWNGYEGQVGVESWVESHFSLLQIVSSQDVAYTYEIWVRN